MKEYYLRCERLIDILLIYCLKFPGTRKRLKQLMEVDAAANGGMAVTRPGDDPLALITPDARIKLQRLYQKI
jgi:hypothetical protein